jgi:hypothetical protein
VQRNALSGLSEENRARHLQRLGLKWDDIVPHMFHSSSQARDRLQTYAMVVGFHSSLDKAGQKGSLGALCCASFCETLARSPETLQRV